MATCPPQQHLQHRAEVQYPHKMPDLDPEGLSKLFDLSSRLPLQGEITPVMALTAVMRHDYAYMLSEADINTIRDTLLPKVRCYGWVLSYPTVLWCLRLA